MRKTRAKLDSLFLFMILLTHTVCTEVDGNYTIGNRIIVPYLNLPKTYLLTGIVLVAFLVIFITEKRKSLTYVEELLYIRVFVSLIPIAYISDGPGEFQVGTVACLLIAPLVFHVGRNIQLNLKKISVFYMMACLIITAQVFYTITARGLNLLSSDLKWWMVLPIGQTNSIGTALLLMFILCENQTDKIEKKRLRTIWIAMLSIVAVTFLFIGSRATLLLLLLYFVIKHVFSKVKSSRNRVYKTIVFGLIIVVISLIVMLEYVEQVTQYIGNFSWTSLTFTRFQVYKESFALFMEHPFFGRSAFPYHVYDAVAAHNFILEALVQGGVIGAALLIAALLCTRMQLLRNVSEYQAFKYVFWFSLLRGLVEPTFFQMGFEVLFWLTVGIGCRKTASKTH